MMEEYRKIFVYLIEVVMRMFVAFFFGFIGTSCVYFFGELTDLNTVNLLNFVGGFIGGTAVLYDFKWVDEENIIFGSWLTLVILQIFGGVYFGYLASQEFIKYFLT